MYTKTIAITAGLDVASVGWDTDHWYFIPDPADCDIGYISANVNRQGNALRFLDVPIPPGSTILYAYLKYCAFSNYDVDVVRAYISAEKSLNPQPFTTYADYISRPRTSKKVNWTDIPHWTLSTWYNSIDFMAVIQEVIDQPGWAEGNPIAIFCEDHDNRSDNIPVCARHAKAYKIEPTRAPQLHLSYLAPGDAPPPSQTGESYTIGGDTLFKCDDPDWQGQSFTVAEAHTLEYIDLQMRGPLKIPTPVVQVFRADPSHFPYGDCLSRNRYIVEQHCGLFTTGRVRFSMQTFPLIPGEDYVIIVSNFPPLLGSSAYWQYDKGDASYLGGMRITTDNSGISWTQHPSDDCLFVEFGTPPIPVTKYDPPLDPFALTDITLAPYVDRLIMTLPTNIPCHLTCYWTDKTPLKHHTTRIVRGLSVPWSVYFCFVSWQAVEQVEAGDTLFHSFNITPWQYCQTRWFTFRGEVDDILSPSVGPIFKYHHPGPPLALYEHYILGDNGSWSLFSTGWLAQTFTPSVSHTIEKVKLKLYRAGLPGTLTVSIRATLAGKPSGPDLAIGSTDGDTLTLDPSGEWREIEFATGFNLNASTQYAIVARISTAVPLNFVGWRGDISGIYAGGRYYGSGDSGVTWEDPGALIDLMFEEWGVEI